LFLAGCGDTINGKAIAEPQVAAFHERLDAKRFDEIYADAADEFRAAGPRERVFALFAAIGRKLGKVKSASTSTWNVNTFNFTTTVVLAVDTEFERGTATETFTFRVSGEKASLVGYNINSLDMLIR
jgi:hypothetical protein